MRRRAGGLLAALVVLGGPATARGADRVTVSRTAGSVVASLSWQGGEGIGVTAPRLAITRAGVAAADVDLADVCPQGCALTAGSEELRASLQVADLDADGEPEVLVDTYSGGAHCCTTARIYGWQPAAGRYGRLRSVAWGDVGYRLQDLDADGRPEMVGADPVFSYAFSSYAASVFPPQVLRFSRAPGTGAARLEDVTRDFPALARRQAARLLRAVRRARPDPAHEIQGALAALVADEYLLGRGSDGRAELRRARRRGLMSPGFESRLLAFLRRHDYR